MANANKTIFGIHDIEGVHDGAIVSEKLGTADDQHDMLRMGKIQKLRRNFGFFSIFGFSMILLSTWETQLGTAAFGLFNGGSAGLIYMYIATACGFSTVVLSMAEMGSMAPTAGGQYHWVSEFAPRRAQRFLSYVVGWLSVLGWQTGSAASAFLAGTEIQGLIALNYPDTYVFQRWHGTLLTIAVASVCCIFNTFFARKLPLVEGCILILHVLGFFAIMIPLLVLSPRRKAEAVFTDFNDNGWGSVGLSCLVGILTPTVSLLGSDAATHMSEELQHASATLPKAMIATIIFNGLFGFGMLLTFLFCLGNIEHVLATPTGYPFIQVFADGTQSIAAATGMTSIMIVLSTCCCMTNMATASRQLFAFARDHAIPYPEIFSTVKWEIPFNAIIFTLGVTSLLSLINIGSTVALNQIISLGVSALISSYIVSISCVCLKRLRKQALLKRHFSLGKYGLPLNITAVSFLLVVYIFSFFPAEPNPSPDHMNWSILIYGCVMIFSLVFFWVKGRHIYVGPVEYVRKDL
ncbi:amino acid transporter [Eremomyces bilateralis CBS 781.70]|uniref:Amino acid transporter n=1 Tax=Eremomyces bilateralis CBS 781.70 TaxID=1392243 RepID=A0A6G1G2L5_9PEZI|nr:amino acid transporter [Eremomyces bilateralis CBS 781.70]KAF1812166.1 amino acid transporter [Eremomyces bilateralis CBS 781.70]